MTDILLIRHGLTDANVTGKIMGRSRDPLNKEGRAQSRKLARFLKETRFDAIYVSPSKRALQTSQALMKGRDAIPLVEDEGVDEINCGRWVGRYISELIGSEEFKSYVSDPMNFTPPDGESLTQAQKRAVGTVEKILAAHKDQNVAVVTHADVIKAILVHYLGMPLNSWQNLKIDNASLSILRFEDGKQPRVMVINHVVEAGRYYQERQYQAIYYQERGGR